MAAKSVDSAYIICKTLCIIIIIIPSILQVHFDENQFKNNRADGRKLLRSFAIPNLLHAIENNSNKDSEVENNSKKVKYSTDNDEYENNANNLNKNSCSNINNGDVIVNLEIVSANYSTNESGYETTDVTMRDTTSNEKLNEKIKSYEEHIKKLKKSLNKTVVERNILKRKLQKRNARFNQIFNEDQRDFITRNTQRGALWSAETITKALRLYAACGQKGYEEVRRQNLPYPSIRTLQNRIQGLKFNPDTIIRT
ncbi:uncharacterized protein [Linepithema humile]|uniref:uncharacterized protein n=1 Tax=Linepithema humile TaxID=83485 RepID=UPI00351E7BD7